MRYLLLAVGLVGGVVLAACGSGATPQNLADALPLNKTHPAFVFFYTDG